MKTSLSVDELFASANLSPCGPIPWGESCGQHSPGVYVVEIGTQIVYVGRTKRSLSRRLKEFYRHKYGDKRPHRGGQEILLLKGDRVIYWSLTNDPVAAERKMIAAYENCFRCLPAGNKKRGDGDGCIYIDDIKNADWLHSIKARGSRT